MSGKEKKKTEKGGERKRCAFQSEKGEKENSTARTVKMTRKKEKVRFPVRKKRKQVMRKKCASQSLARLRPLDKHL
jgi:hypothetical protein